MRLGIRIVLLLLFTCLMGCVSTTLRLPASFKPRYNSHIVSSLKTAALNGVLFQVHDSVFRDVPSRQVNHCRKAEAPTWSEELVDFLNLMDRNPHYYNKFYIVDFKRGDQSKAEITRDIDGLSYLTITYSKRENREKVTPLTVLPCADTAAQHLGKDLVTTSIDWPSIEQIDRLLSGAADKVRIDRFQFNTDFLVYLAERQTILKINPEVAFARTYQGDYFLGNWLEKMAQELREPNIELSFVNYWLKEISTRSKQAKTIQFFGLHSESTINAGVQVDSVGKFNRKINNYQEPTYIFMAYKERGGEYVHNSLKELNTCLQSLLGSYRSLSMNYETDGDSFLAPGYSCKMEGQE